MEHGKELLEFLASTESYERSTQNRELELRTEK